MLQVVTDLDAQEPRDKLTTRSAYLRDRFLQLSFGNALVDRDRLFAQSPFSDHTLVAASNSMASSQQPQAFPNVKRPITNAASSSLSVIVESNQLRPFVGVCIWGPRPTVGKLAMPVDRLRPRVGWCLDRLCLRFRCRYRPQST
jgi:hypothetical protein